MKSWIPKHGLSSKLILYVFVNVIVITAIIFTYIYRVSHDEILSNLKENSRLLTLSTVHEVEKNLIALQIAADNRARIMEASSASSSELEQLLIMLVKDNTEIFGASLSFEPDYKGRASGFSTLHVVRDENGIHAKYAGTDNYDSHVNDWYLIPKELQKPVWSEPYYDSELPNIKKVTYSVPIFQSDQAGKKFIGILAADLSLDWLDSTISSIKIYKTGYAFMISQNGSLLSHPNKDYIANETIFSLAEEANSTVLHEIGRNMVKGKTSFAEVEYRNLVTGKKSWLTYAPVAMSGWSLGIVYPVDELTAPLNRLFTMVIVLASIGGAILLFFIILISRSITSPLRKLAVATQGISEGNFDVNLPKIKAKDEIRDLTDSFSVMQGALRQTIERLKSANDELENYSRTLEEKVELRTTELREKNRDLDKAIQNVRILSEIGRHITSTLQMETIFATVYDGVNQLLDASIFAIMILNQKEKRIDTKLAIENGERLPEFTYSLDDKNRYSVWCVENRKPIFINDIDAEYSKYVTDRVEAKIGHYGRSLMLYPLIVGDKILGALCAQSFRKDAYTETHLDFMSSIASYTAIALDNALAYENINRAHEDLKNAQAQLIQTEKMASLGQLTAGIAHEIKNPLNFVNNFAELSTDLTRELGEIVDKESDKFDKSTMDYIKEIMADLDHNVRKICDHGKRADSIVKGMLLHSRGKAGEKQKTNLHDLIDEDLNLAYHGFRAQDATFNIKLEKHYDNTLETINVVPQNISRVLLNIFNNSFYSVHEKKKDRKDGYDPLLVITTENHQDRVEIRIRDNGKGIPADIMDKVFNPFFTTKPTGKGTGLGLSLSYDIVVQEHKGEFKVQSEAGEYAEFTVVIPKNL
jgi:signal transduction histidine kinase/methyl-accepting chemotaxis protein